MFHFSRILRSTCLAFLTGIGLFLGLSMMTATHLRADGAPLGWLPGLRAALLATGVLWSVWLGLHLLKLWGVAPSLASLGTAATQRPAPFGLVSRGNTPAKFLAAMIAAVPVPLVAASWYPLFFVW